MLRLRRSLGAAASKAALKKRAAHALDGCPENASRQRALLFLVCGDHESAASDSHYDGLLSPPSYTRPPEYQGRAVPEVLLSGNHAEIEAWRLAEAERLTRERRPDLWTEYDARQS